MSLWLMIFGGALTLMWGAAHIFPTRSVVAGFGELSPDNRRVLTMEWIAEGMTLMFLGLLVLLVCRSVAVEHSARLAVRACVAMLIALATLSAATGARTSILPMRICPLVKLTAAGLLIAGTWGWVDHAPVSRGQPATRHICGKMGRPMNRRSARCVDRASVTPPMFASANDRCGSPIAPLNSRFRFVRPAASDDSRQRPHAAADRDHGHHTRRGGRSRGGLRGRRR